MRKVWKLKGKKEIGMEEKGEAKRRRRRMRVKEERMSELDDR